MRKSIRLAADKATHACETPGCAACQRASVVDPDVRAELLDITPYDLRHSFLTLVPGITRDQRAVQEIAQHADIRQTHRYTKATIDARTLAAHEQVAKWLQEPKNHP